MFLQTRSPLPSGEVTPRFDVSYDFTHNARLNRSDSSGKATAVCEPWTTTSAGCSRRLSQDSCLDQILPAAVAAVAQAEREENGHHGDRHDQDAQQHVGRGQRHQEVVGGVLQLLLQRHGQDDQDVPHHRDGDDGQNQQRCPVLLRRAARRRPVSQLRVDGAGTRRGGDVDEAATGPGVRLQTGPRRLGGQLGQVHGVASGRLPGKWVNAAGGGGTGGHHGAARRAQVNTINTAPSISGLMRRHSFTPSSQRETRRRSPRSRSVRRNRTKSHKPRVGGRVFQNTLKPNAVLLLTHMSSIKSSRRLMTGSTWERQTSAPGFCSSKILSWREHEVRVRCGGGRVKVLRHPVWTGSAQSCCGGSPAAAADSDRPSG